MSALTAMSATPSAHWPTNRVVPAARRADRAPSTVKNAATAGSVVAAYGQPTAHAAITCEAGTSETRTATHRLELDDQPRARRPRYITRDSEPSRSEASKRIHCRLCTLVVCP